MKLYKKGNTILIDHAGLQYSTNRNWDELTNRTNLYEKLLAELSSFTRISEIDLQQSFDPPMQSQEIWAAGVTYFRSMEARMEESKEAGGGSFYDKVYNADRPEYFSNLLHIVRLGIKVRSGYAGIQPGMFRNRNLPCSFLRAVPLKVLPLEMM